MKLLQGSSLAGHVAQGSLSHPCFSPRAAASGETPWMGTTDLSLPNAFCSLSLKPGRAPAAHQCARAPPDRPGNVHNRLQVGCKPGAAARRKGHGGEG